MSKIYIVKSGDTLSKIASSANITLIELLSLNKDILNPNKIKVGDKVILPDNKSATIEIEEPLAVVNVNTSDKSIDESTLGSLSAKYEVGNRGAGTVSTGIGDAGGASYGSYQMTSKPNGGTATVFVRSSSFANKFKGLVAGTPAFTNVWKSLATSNPKEFQDAQHLFIKERFYDVEAQRVKQQERIDVSKHSLALKNVFWSTAVQHGPNNSIIFNAIERLNGLSELSPDFDSTLIKAIYTERGKKRANGTLVYFGRNSLQVQKGVANRFINEQRDALNMLAKEKG